MICIVFKKGQAVWDKGLTKEDHTTSEKRKYNCVDCGKSISIYAKRCSSCAKKGRISNNWKRGYYFDKQSNKIVLTGKHKCPYSDRRGIVKRCIYVWWLNFPDDPILKGEIIHHINGIKTDDRIENLKKMTRGEHTRLHHKQRGYSVWNKEQIDFLIKNYKRFKSNELERLLLFKGKTSKEICSKRKELGLYKRGKKNRDQNL